MPTEDPTLSTVIAEDLEKEKRYDLIEEIEGEIQRILEIDDVRVMTYISKDAMTRDDVKAFEDMLQAVDEPDLLCLVIDSPGGDPETAIRIIKMVRERSARFEAIIPDMAKSAATQVCLGSKRVWMGYNSEIGPIDPQIPFRNGWTPAKTIIEGLEFIEQRAAENEDVPTKVYMSISQHYDAAKLREAKNAMNYIRESATEITGDMFDDDEDANACIEQLLSEDSHGKPIGADDAEDLGLDVFDLRDHDHLWSCVWELYIRSDVAMDGNSVGKLLETSSHSIAYHKQGAETQE